MAQKTSSLVLTYDRDCCRCNKKVRKLLAEFPEIQKLDFDDKQKKVTISGPFDPEMLKKKLWCKACSCIISIEIPPPPKPAKVEPPKVDPPKPPPSPPVNVIVVCPYGSKACCRPCCDPEPRVCCKPSCEGPCKCPNMCYKPCFEEYPCHGTCICRRPGCDSGCGSYCEGGQSNCKTM